VAKDYLFGLYFLALMRYPILYAILITTCLSNAQKLIILKSARLDLIDYQDHFFSFSFPFPLNIYLILVFWREKMGGKCRFWIVAACILQVLYGLAFMSMGVAASYLCRQSSCTWSTGVIAAGASNNILQSNWQSAKAPALALDAGTPPLSLKKIPGISYQLSIFSYLTYTYTY
jgi:hypothetical protein